MPVSAEPSLQYPGGLVYESNYEIRRLCLSSGVTMWRSQRVVNLQRMGKIWNLFCSAQVSKDNH